jgi:hypothetical protein
MSDSKPSRIGNIAFWLWIAGGVGLVVANWCFWDYYYSHYPTGHAERTFSYFGPYPRQAAKISREERRVLSHEEVLALMSPEERRESEEGRAIRRERDNFEAWWPSLLFGTVVYGFAGAVLFRHRGNDVFVFASAIALLSLFCGCHLEL